MRRQALGLVTCAVPTFVAALLGGIASANARDFYAALARPAWAPPGWVFGPVWTTLYVSMAIAAWLVWRKRGLAGARTALGLFAAQLAANALWSWLFFAWRQGELALVDAIVLAILVLATIAAFHRISALAAWLLYPYLAWCVFASALTFGILRLNPAAL